MTPSESLVSANSAPVFSGVPTAPASSGVVVIFDTIRPIEDVPLPPGFEDIDDLVERLEEPEDQRKLFAVARAEIARKMPLSLASLRLERGLSQKQLALRMGTSQSHVARIESGSLKIYLETANHLANELNVSLDVVNAACGYDKKQSE